MMAKKKQGQTRPAKKPKAATIPNLYWRSITMEQLRQQDRCLALAPVDHKDMQQGRLSQRYVRQDSHLWSLLHDGMLTTGRLKAALGMHESAAAAVIGIHPGSRGSSHMLAAYSHLVTTTYIRNSTTSAAGGMSSSSEGSWSSAAGGTPAPGNGTVALASNQQGPQVALQQQFGGLLPRPIMLQPQSAPSQKQQNAQKLPLQQRYGGLLPRPVMLQVPAAQQYSTAQPVQQQQRPQLNHHQQQQSQEEGAVARLEASRRAYNQQLARQASTAAAGAASGPVADAAPGDVEQATSSAAVQAARQHSERAAAGGDLQVKMSWGKTQEAAALYCVMQLFPDSLLEEVGLFELDPSQLPASWNTQPGLLPPLGASPDAALVHKLTLMPEDLQAAAALLARKNTTSGAAAATAAGGASSGGIDSAAAEAAEAAAVQLLLQRGYDRLACAGKRPAPNGVQYADSSEESVPSSSHGSSEAESDHTSDEEGDDSHSSAPAAASSNTQPSQTAGTAASSGVSTAGVNGSVVSSSAGPEGSPSSTSVSLSAEQAGSLAFEPVAASLLRVLHDWQQQAAPLEQAVTVMVREAVEVKNHCPFGVRYARSGKKGRTELAFKLSPRGCAGRVHPQWIPQLQLHMAATGCQSVLLASRCAAQGMCVYRVWRDDAYLRDMMLLLQELQACHVLRQVPPRPDSLSRLAAHKPFLNKTVALARGAECIAAAGDEFVASVPSNAVNQSQFWQPL